MKITMKVRHQGAVRLEKYLELDEADALALLGVSGTPMGSVVGVGLGVVAIGEEDVAVYFERN